MKREQAALADRIRQVRRRHFGPRGKSRFARELEVSLAQYEKFERGTVPPGHLLVRICETTGEDLQWLLTGLASRGTMVISGTRARHQELIARVAELVDSDPSCAAPLDAFVELLARGREAREPITQALTAPDPRHLLAIRDADEQPPEDTKDEPRQLACVEAQGRVTRRRPAQLLEPSQKAAPAKPQPVTLITLQTDDDNARDFVLSAELANCFPGMFGVRLADDAMAPMFEAGDVALVALQTGPKPGAPALCKFSGEATLRCRVWLEQSDEEIVLGRVADGVSEHEPRERLVWSLEVLYRVVPAA